MRVFLNEHTINEICLFDGRVETDPKNQGYLRKCYLVLTTHAKSGTPFYRYFTSSFIRHRIFSCLCTTCLFL